MAHFLDHLGPAIETWWADLGAPHLDATACRFLTDAFATPDAATFARQVADRDRALLRRLAARAQDRDD